MFICPRCKKERIAQDVFTGIYFCKQCGYQGTFVIMKDEEQKSLNINSTSKKHNEAKRI